MERPLSNRPRSRAVRWALGLMLVLTCAVVVTLRQARPSQGPEFVGRWAQRSPSGPRIDSIWTLKADGVMESLDPDTGTAKEMRWSSTSRNFTVHLADHTVLRQALGRLQTWWEGLPPSTAVFERTLTWERVPDDYVEILRLRGWDTSGKREIVYDLERLPE